MKRTAEETLILNRVYCLFMLHMQCADNWLGIILDPAVGADLYPLRAKAFALWYSALLDTVEAAGDLTEKYRRQSLESGQDHLVSYLNAFDEFAAETAKFMSKLTKEEQMLVYDFRDSLVHAYLKGINMPEKRVRYVEDGKLVVESVSFDEYHRRIWTVTRLGESFDGTILSFRERVMESVPSAYWGGIRFLQGNLDHMYQAMQKGIPYAHPKYHVAKKT